MFDINPFFVASVLLIAGGLATAAYFFFGHSSGGASLGQSVKRAVTKAPIKLAANGESIGKDPRWQVTLDSIELFQLEASERESELLEENAKLRAEIDRINRQLGGILDSSPKVEVPVQPAPKPKKKEESTL